MNKHDDFQQVKISGKLVKPQCDRVLMVCLVLLVDMRPRLTPDLKSFDHDGREDAGAFTCIIYGDRVWRKMDTMLTHCSDSDL